MASLLMRIGIISLEWLPRYGGAMIYVHRIARELVALGHEVKIATATASEPGYDNGVVDAYRSAGPVSPEDPAEIQRWFRSLDGWLRTHGFSHVLINAPLTRVSHAYARELYDLVRNAGCLVGGFHYDLGRDIAAELAWGFGFKGSWEAAANAVTAKLREHLTCAGESQGYLDIESPFYFSPDFVVSCSVWSGQFIDPFAGRPRFSLRPWIEASFAQPVFETASGLAKVDISFLNPLVHKGRETLIEIIREAPEGWRFRVLNGGYGEGAGPLLDAIRNTRAWREGRIQALDYCRDMRAFYDATRVFLFPSLYEGYGMAAVESLFRGVPTVVREYPSILEGVGDGAMVVPYMASTAEWITSLKNVLDQEQAWAERARRRTVFLLDRQKEEMREFVEFLQRM